MGDIGNWAIKILVGLLLAAILLPIVVAEWLGADQTGWDAQWIALWAIVPIAIFITLIVKVFRGTGRTG